MADLSDAASIWAQLSNDSTLAAHILVPPPTTLSVGCVEDSLSYGLWKIEDFTYSETTPDDASSQTFSFDISSAIDDWRFTCSFNGGDGVLDKECVPEDESIRRVDWFMAERVPNSDAVTLSVSMSWECDGSSIAFAADSEAQIPVTTEEDSHTLTADPLEIPYTLNTPVNLTPSLEAPAPPPGSQDPQCRTASQSPSWEVSDISWSWPPGPGGDPPPARFRARLTNSVTGQTTLCGVSGSGVAPGPRTNPGAFGPGKPLWHDCDGEVWMDEFGGEYKSKLAIRWGGWEETLEVVESWFCDGEPPVEFIGYTHVDLTPDDFQCTSAPDPGAVKPPGESGVSPPRVTVCTTVWPTKELPGITVADFDLPERAFDFAKPHADGCLISSIDPDNHYWDFHTDSFTYQPADDGRIRAVLEMGVMSGYPGGVFNCSDPFSEPSGTGYCGNPPLPGAEWESQTIAFDGVGVFSIEQSWVCNDRSAQNPVVFTASGKVELPELTCGEDGVCGVDAGGSIRIPMDIKWDTE